MINQFDIEERYLCQYNTKMVEFAKSIGIDASKGNCSVDFVIADMKFNICIGIFDSAYVILNLYLTQKISERRRIAYVDFIKTLLPNMVLSGPLGTKCSSLASAEKLMKSTIERLGQAKDKFEEIKNTIK